MRITRITGIVLIGILLVLGACGSPTRITPPAPAQTPAPTTPAPTQPTPNQPAPVPGAASFTAGAFVISNLGLDPEMPDPGDPVTVSVKVANNGAQQGTYKVDVKVDGITAGTRDVTLAAGASQVVNVTIEAPGKEGTFTIAVGQLTTTMVVMAM